MQLDSVTTIGSSTCQMGAFNDRIYLMKLSGEDSTHMAGTLLRIAKENKYSKVFAKIPDTAASHFISAGYRVEAEVPSLFPDANGIFASYYCEEWRSDVANEKELAEVLAVAQNKHGKLAPVTLPEGMKLGTVSPSKLDMLATLYTTTFDTYPFPIHDEKYLASEQQNGTIFVAVEYQGGIIGAASAEVSPDGWSAEMTDFAVMPAYRCAGIASAILTQLEQQCAERGIQRLFTIARACSYGINSLFSKHRYTYSGTLANNTNISGSLETMNVWHKPARA